MKLSEMVKKYRTEHKYSLRDFGNICGLSFVQISLLERGVNAKGKPFTPSFDTLCKLAKGMGTDFETLIRSVDDFPVSLTGNDYINNRGISPENEALIAWASSLPPEQAAAWCKAFGLSVIES